MVEKRGYRLKASRKIFTTCGFLCSAAVLLPVSPVRSLNPWVSTVLFSLANAFFGPRRWWNCPLPRLRPAPRRPRWTV